MYFELDTQNLFFLISSITIYYQYIVIQGQTTRVKLLKDQLLMVSERLTSYYELWQHISMNQQKMSSVFLTIILPLSKFRDHP